LGSAGKIWEEENYFAEIDFEKKKINRKLRK